jgi:hypothetical protein
MALGLSCGSVGTATRCDCETAIDIGFLLLEPVEKPMHATGFEAENACRYEAGDFGLPRGRKTMSVLVDTGVPGEKRGR